MSDRGYQDVPSREGNLPNTEPQAPRSIPLSEIQRDKTGGGGSGKFWFKSKKNSQPQKEKTNQNNFNNNEIY